MDSAQQADGEKRVKRVLIEPLERRGLMKPGGMTKALFEEMKAELCSKLAYMSELNLAALEEEAAGLAGGKEKDRFPIANRVLPKAADIQSPGDDASPLIRAVFASQLGLDALAGGWAPELLNELKRVRRWPGAFVVNQIKQQADDAVRRMINFDAVLANGRALAPAEDQWRSRRQVILGKCRRISEMGNGGGGE